LVGVISQTALGIWLFMSFTAIERNRLAGELLKRLFAPIHQAGD
jgi:hypothetical protein